MRRTDRLSPRVRKALDPHHFFSPMGKPRPGDWPDRHAEPGQTFDQFAAAGYNRPDKHRSTLVLRSLKVLVHETGHMFGMQHCVFFNCVMNGSNHLGEIDRRPIHLCPVCLRKLENAVGFDVVVRYRALERLYRRFKLSGQADWVAGRIRWFEGEEK